MLTADRFDAILTLLAQQGSVTVTGLAQSLGLSESTIRRDLNELDKQGRLTKVHGGAVAAGTPLVSRDDKVAERRSRNHDDKLRIAKAAAALVQPGDFVYIDAGTTTDLMAAMVTEPGATYVTNSLTVAKTLAEKGLACYLPGGQFKASTEAIVGEAAITGLAVYHFTKGFFGANGITPEQGFTTPEPGEAAVKRAAWEACRTRYVLADASKLGRAAPVTFAAFSTGEVLTCGHLDPAYKSHPNITEV